MIEHSDRRRSSQEQHSCRAITADRNRFITYIALCQSSRHPPQYQAFCNSLRSLPRTPNAKSYDLCTTHRILRNGHWFRFIVGRPLSLKAIACAAHFGWRVSITRVLCPIGLMLKKQATSAEDPEQEDEDAAGVTSVE